MPRRKTARRKRGGSQDPLAPWIERLQVIRDSGMQPSETHLNQIHQEIMGILAQGGQSSLKDQVFDLLEQIHDLPQGGRRRIKAQSRRKTRRAGTSRP